MEGQTLIIKLMFHYSNIATQNGALVQITDAPFYLNTRKERRRNNDGYKATFG